MWKISGYTLRPQIFNIAFSMKQAQAQGPYAMTSSRIFSVRPDLTQSISISTSEHWLRFDKFEKVCSNLKRLARENQNWDSTMKSFPLFFRVRTRNSQFIEKRVLFSHCCLLLSLIFATEANNASFFFSLATKPYKCTRTGRLFPDRVTSTCPALHTSAFTTVFYEITRNTIL